MSLHHLNRFKAHSEAHLSPTERLLAWHFAYEIRLKTNYYSESVRRLSDELELHPRTIIRGLSRLVDLGLFERIDRTGTYAPIYRLLVTCPAECFALDDHNTKQELATLEGLPLLKTPALTGTHATPYIEKRDEEDWGALELGFILEALGKLSSMNADQMTLKGFVELNPRAVAQAALEITKDLDSTKRKRAYLATTATKTPSKLFIYAEDNTARLEGSIRLQKAKPDTAKRTDLISELALLNSDEEPEQYAKLRAELEAVEQAIRAKNKTAEKVEGIEPEHTWERIQQFATQATLNPDYTPSYAVRNYLEKKAAKGELTSREINFGSILESVLVRKAFPFMKTKVADLDDGSIYFDVNQDGQLVAKGFLQNWLQGDLSFIYTAEEAKQLKDQQDGLKDLRKLWEMYHPDEDFSPSSFFMSSDVQTFLRLNPDPITEDEKNKRFLDLFTKTARSFEIELTDLPEAAESETFSFWLNQAFSVEDDFKDFLLCYPERETGSHRKNYKKALPAYYQARRKFHPSDLRSFARTYWNRLDKQEFAKNPETFLLDLVAEVAEPGKVAF